MPQQVINLGATGSGAGGDSARTAFEKAIANFAELYIAALPGTAAQKQAARNMFGLGDASTRAVLGTVSQSGGVPTGAIIERGSNSLGEYIRFADGTQICTGRVSIDLSNASAQNINWPANFTGVVPFYLVIDSSPGLPSSSIYDAFQSIAAMSDASTRGRVVVRTTAPYTVQCLFVATGRWY